MAALLSLGNEETQYRLESLIHHGKVGPEATIEQKDLNLDGQDQHKVTIIDDVNDLSKNVILLYRQHGKFTILTGKELAEKQLAKNSKVVGRIVSSPTLKKSKLYDESEYVVEEESRKSDWGNKKSTRDYDREFANKPKIQIRNKRYQGEAA